MKVFFQIVLLVVFSCLFSSCIIDGTGYYSFYQFSNPCKMQSDQRTGAPLTWKKDDFPIPFYVHESVPHDAHINFLAAVGHWNDAWLEYLDDKGVSRKKQFRLFKVIDPQRKYMGKQKSINDKNNYLIFPNNFNQYDKKVQGITIVHTVVNRKGANIEDTDILINSEDYSYFFDESYNDDFLYEKKSDRTLASSRSFGFFENTMFHIKIFFVRILEILKKETKRNLDATRIHIPARSVDFPSLIIHELGHVPGLGHVDDPHTIDLHQASVSSNSRSKNLDSVMEARLRLGYARRHIGDYDLGILYCGYFESDSEKDSVKNDEI